jgi:hypothetical protein
MVSLEQNEYIVKEVRRHWFFVFTRATLYIFFAFIPILVYPFIVPFLPAVLLVEGGTLSIAAPMYTLWLLMLWVAFFFFWTDYYLDVLVVTNCRIMDIEQRGFFNREISEFRLENIQDITIDIQGFLPTMLDFGDVHVQTASENREFIIKDAAHPEAVKRLIANEHDKSIENIQLNKRPV